MASKTGNLCQKMQHKMTASNTYVHPTKGKLCRGCLRDYQREYMAEWRAAKKKAAARAAKKLATKPAAKKAAAKKPAAKKPAAKKAAKKSARSRR